MNWIHLVTRDSEGYCAAVDVEAIVSLFRDFVESRNCKMEIDGRRLAHQILRYIQLRSSVGEHEISNPQIVVTKPPGWSAEKEREWILWIYHIFRLEDWQTEIMDPIFGSDERWWEAACGGWRDELFWFLPWWIKRFVVVNEEEDAEKESEEGTKIDPYLLEHGSAKQRRSAKD
jgi:hypothetical protein